MWIQTHRHAPIPQTDADIGNPLCLFWLWLLAAAVFSVLSPGSFVAIADNACPRLPGPFKCQHSQAGCAVKCLLMRYSSWVGVNHWDGIKECLWCRKRCLWIFSTGWKLSNQRGYVVFINKPKFPCSHIKASSLTLHQTGEFPLILPWKTMSKKTRLGLGTKQDFLICGAERTAKTKQGCCIHFQFVLLSVYLWVCARTHTRVWFKAHSNRSCSLLESFSQSISFFFFFPLSLKTWLQNRINNSTTTVRKHTGVDAGPCHLCRRRNISAPYPQKSYPTPTCPWDGFSWGTVVGSIMR